MHRDAATPGRYKATPSNAPLKTAIADTLIREMTIHGNAEEVSVYREYGAVDRSEIAAHNILQHAEIKHLLRDADSARMTRDDYDTILERAVTLFLSHATLEEEEQLPFIRRKLSAEENDVRTCDLRRIAWLTQSRVG